MQLGISEESEINSSLSPPLSLQPVAPATCARYKRPMAPKQQNPSLSAQTAAAAAKKIVQLEGVGVEKNEKVGTLNMT
jgi:hypothetical protein